MASASIDLLVATLDLKLVQSITGAMRAADAAAAKALPAANLIGRHVIHPTDRFEPRHVIHPTPRFEPRYVLHPTSRIEPRPVQGPIEMTPARANRLIPPVWKQLIWKCDPTREVQVKIIVRKPDVIKRGTLIDLFM